MLFIVWADCALGERLVVDLSLKDTQESGASLRLPGARCSGDINAYKKHPFMVEKEEWTHLVADEVRRFQSIRKDVRKAFYCKDGGFISSLSFQMAVVSALLPKLQKAGRVIDMGAGTGSLVAMFAEAVRGDTVVEGYEYDKDIAEMARWNLELFSEWPFLDSSCSERLLRMSEDGIYAGNAFTFNVNGNLQEDIDVVNMGFAVGTSLNDVPPGIFKAVKLGGWIGLPLCNAPLEVLNDDESSDASKCKSTYRVYEKIDHGNFVPVSNLPLSNMSINFSYVPPGVHG